MAAAMGAAQLEQVVLRDHRAYGRKLRHLEDHGIAHPRRTLQILAAAPTGGGVVRQRLIDPLRKNPAAVVPLVPLLSPPLAAARLRLRPRRSAGRIRRRRTGRVARMLRQASTKLGHLRLQRGDLRLQHEDRPAHSGREYLARSFQLGYHRHGRDPAAFPAPAYPAERLPAGYCRYAPQRSLPMMPR
jgi:hypothetical protein